MFFRHGQVCDLDGVIPSLVVSVHLKCLQVWPDDGWCCRGIRGMGQCGLACVYITLYSCIHHLYNNRQTVYWGWEYSVLGTARYLLGESWSWCPMLSVGYRGMMLQNHSTCWHTHLSHPLSWSPFPGTGKAEAWNHGSNVLSGNSTQTEGIVNDINESVEVTSLYSTLRNSIKLWASSTEPVNYRPQWVHGLLFVAISDSSCFVL